MFTEKFFAIAQVGHEVTLWVLIILSIFSVAFILERYITLSRIKSRSQKAAVRIRETLQTGSWDDLEDISKDRDSLEGRGLALGLRHVKERGANGLEEIFNSHSMLERPQLERYLSFLATVGSNAPFIGLLGTVFGIMDAFRGLATSQGDAAAVMIGISKALVATAIGLLVAIPAVIAFNYFQRQARGVLQSLETVRDVCLAFAKSRKGNNSN